MGTDCGSQPDALGSGSQCYIDQAKYYNDAFGVFFQRLAADGITPKNTLFVLSSDEGDHEAGANVGRAVAPSPAGCDGVTVPCTYTVVELRRDQRQRHRPAGQRDRQHHAVQHGERHRAGVLPDRQPRSGYAGGANVRARRGEPDQPAQPLLGHGQRKDHELPGQPGGGRDPALRQRGPGADADAGHVRQAGLLPAVVAASQVRARASSSARPTGSPGTTATTRPRSTPTTSASSGRA